MYLSDVYVVISVILFAINIVLLVRTWKEDHNGTDEVH